MTWYQAGIRGVLTPRDLLENVHGPLYSLLLHLWCGLSGDGEWALRLPSALFGIALVPALAWFAARWLGRETAVPAAWLAAGSPFLIWYSQEARNYSLLMLCATLAGGALVSMRAALAPRGVAGYVAAAGAGLLSNFSFALLIPLHLRWWRGEPGWKARRLAALAATLGGMLLLVSPWAPQAARIWDWQRLHPGREAGAAETPLRGATTFHAGAIPFAAYAFAAGYTLGPSLRELRADPSPRALRRHAPALVSVTLVFGALGSLGLAALRRRGRLGEALLWLLPPLALVSYFALQNFKVFHPRYLAVAFPCFALVLAAALADLRPRPRALAGFAVGVLWLASLHHHYFDPRYGKEDYRGAAALVRAGGRAGERLLAVNAEDPMFYYYRGPLSQTRLWLGFARDPSRLEQKLSEALAGAGGVWVVLSRPEDLDPAGEFAKILDLRFPDAERFQLEGVRVWHIQPGPPREGAASGT